MPRQSAKVLTTDSQVAAAKAPPTGRATYRIGKAPNLVLRVTASGNKSWGYWLRDKKTDRWRMLTIGRYPATSLARAKQEAQRLAVAYAEGGDPFANDKSTLTFTELSARYLERHAKPKKRTWAEDQRSLNADVLPVLGRHIAAEVSRSDVVRVLDRISDRGAGILANRTLALLRKLFNWAVGEGYLTINPAQGIPMRVKEEARERTLSADELRTFWHALDGFEPTTADALRLQLLLGARIREITGMERSELSLDQPLPIWTLPKARAKGQRDVSRPLPALALTIVLRRLSASEGSPFLFASPADPAKPITPRAPTRAVERAARRGNIPKGFAPHDLRRTMATGIASLGISEAVAKRILGHAPLRSDVLGTVYNRHNYLNEMYTALEAWERHVLAIADGRDSTLKVLALRSVGGPRERTSQHS